MSFRKTHIDFFLVGAAKSGTTSLTDWLKSHPNIFIPAIKETNYFSTDIEVERFSPAYEQNTFLDLENYFKNEPLKPLHITFLHKEKHLHQLYASSPPDCIAGECSTSHLFSKAAPNNIFNHNPQAKILMVLRNPIERAFSHYLMARKYGFTRLNFRDAIQTDLRSRSKAWGQSELFVELGMYSKQIQRYQNLFPGGQIHILKFEDLISRPQKTFDNICLFLGVPKANIPEQEQHNQAGLPRLNNLNLWLTQTGLKKTIAKVIPINFKERLKKFYYTDVNLPTLKPEDKSFMMELFREDIERTERLTGMDLSEWLK